MADMVGTGLVDVDRMDYECFEQGLEILNNNSICLVQNDIHIINGSLPVIHSRRKYSNIGQLCNKYRASGENPFPIQKEVNR